jgi:hypothetical protein
MICFSVITNGYDDLREPYISKGWRYVLFSDQFVESDNWECYITEKPDREIKIKGYTELFHQPALYVDANIRIIGDLNEFRKEITGWFDIWKHPHRGCIFDEAKAVIKLKKADPVMVNHQMNKYGFMPKHWGLGANGIMFRDFGDPVVRNICELWWKEYQQGSSRDQLSLMPVFYSLGLRPNFFNNEVFDKYFRWEKHRR